MKTIIIDSNNLIHKVTEFKRLFSENPETAQHTLIESVKSKIRKDCKPVFVFDGFGNIKRKNVEYSGKQSADDVIKKYIEENYEKKSLMIVSSDLGITRLARVCGCEVKKSEEFWKELNPTPLKGKNINQLLYKNGEKPDRISKKELEEFKKYFT